MFITLVLVSNEVNNSVAYINFLEHGYFRGSWLAVMSSDGNVANGSLLKLRTRFGNVINMITSCGDETDDTVQLQVTI